VVLGLAIALSTWAAAASADEARHRNIAPISVCPTCSTLPFGINDRDQVTGLFFDAAGHGRGFLKTGNHYDVIDIPGAQLVEAQRSNNAGYVLGDYLGADGIGRPFVRRPNGSLDLRPGFPGATFTGAIFLHEDGRIIGYATRDPAQLAGYFVYFLDGTTYSEPWSYPAPDVVSTFLVSVNHRGEWVGAVEIGTVQNEHGWYRSPSGEFRLIDFPGAIQTEVFDITDNGLMLGRYMDTQHINHGFFLDHGVFSAFDYVGPQTYIWKINHRGNVVGYSFENNAYGPPAQGFVTQR
jgi:hypothetical protein